ncbi:hypothetical protein EDC01DRAFT_750889 [Geopyxis carbonaria]|nr:hypothetical protein EDC01DRAFT_750889 [Geopyxis carbonaria]
MSARFSTIFSNEELDLSLSFISQQALFEDTNDICDSNSEHEQDENPQAYGYPENEDKSRDYPATMYTKSTSSSATSSPLIGSFPSPPGRNSFTSFASDDLVSPITSVSSSPHRSHHSHRSIRGLPAPPRRTNPSHNPRIHIAVPPPLLELASPPPTAPIPKKGFEPPMFLPSRTSNRESRDIFAEFSALPSFCPEPKRELRAEERTVAGFAMELDGTPVPPPQQQLAAPSPTCTCQHSPRSPQPQPPPSPAPTVFPGPAPNFHRANLVDTAPPSAALPATPETHSRSRSFLRKRSPRSSIFSLFSLRGRSRSTGPPAPTQDALVSARSARSSRSASPFSTPRGVSPPTISYPRARAPTPPGFTVENVSTRPGPASSLAPIRICDLPQRPRTADAPRTQAHAYTPTPDLNVVPPTPGHSTEWVPQGLGRKATISRPVMLQTTPVRSATTASRGGRDGRGRMQRSRSGNANGQVRRADSRVRRSIVDARPGGGLPVMVSREVPRVLQAGAA